MENDGKHHFNKVQKHYISKNISIFKDKFDSRFHMKLDVSYKLYTTRRKFYYSTNVFCNTDVEVF